MLQRLLTRLKRFFCLQHQREESLPYLFLRIARAQRWQHNDPGKSPTAEDAVEDLKLRPEEKGLSLYRLHKEDEVDKL